MITLVLGGFDRRRETTSRLGCYSLHCRASSFCYLFLNILARAMCKVPLAEAETWNTKNT